MITGWTVTIDGYGAYFPIYPTRRKAREVAAAYRSYWGHHHHYGVAKCWGTPGFGLKPDTP